jgi:hypothetical protein
VYDIGRDSTEIELMPENKNLANALLAFQAEAPTLVKSADNPYFGSKYVPLDAVVETIQPLLTKHGLVWTATPSYDGDATPTLRYQLTHAPSGESLTDSMPLLLPKRDPQGQGSAITYARRYALCAVLNLVADVDDDANAASNGASAPQAIAKTPQPTERRASARQRGLLNGRAAEAGLSSVQYANCLLLAQGEEARESEDQERAQKYVNRALDQLPASLVDKVLAEISRIKEAAAA